MPFTLNVTGDMKAIAKDLDLIERKIQRQAAAAALNKAASAIRTASVREIASTKHITPQKLVRARLIFGRRQRATRRRLVAFVFALLNPIRSFGLSRPGPAARARRTPGAFIARMPSGHTGIFKRTGEAKRRMKRGRYAGTGILREPIKEQTIALQPEAEHIIRKHQDTTGADAWVKNFNREMRRRLAKKRA